MAPKQKPGRSKQDYATPRTFIKAVERRFGPITLDLAAHAENAVCDRWLGPGSLHEDSLMVDWGAMMKPFAGDIAWLNPEYADIATWARKCRDQARRWPGLRVLMLAPNGLGSNWYRDFVQGEAGTLVVNGRIMFQGTRQGYPKDHLLILWGRSFGVRGVDTWTLPPYARSDTHKLSEDYLAGRR